MASAAIILLRYILLQAGAITIADENKENQQTLVAASSTAFKELQHLLQMAGRTKRVLGRLALFMDQETAIGKLDQLSNLLKAIQVREIIFCIDEQLPMKLALAIVQKHKHLRYAFHYYGSHSIIGSNSKDMSGEAVAVKTSFNLSRRAHCRNKRLVDISTSLILLITFPIHLFLIKKPLHFMSNCLQVLRGKYTWISYHFAAAELPAIKPGILMPNAMPIADGKYLPEQSLKTIDEWYAKEYNWKRDVKLLLKGYRKMGAY